MNVEATGFWMKESLSTFLFWVVVLCVLGDQDSGCYRRYE
jgi:hypothetical protein